MAGRLQGKVTIVTGAGSGIGQGTAILFAREGATVIGVDINRETLVETAASAAQSGRKLDQQICDLTNEADVNQLMKDVAAKYGGIDALVTAAGFVEFAPIADMTLAQWRKTLLGELDTVFLTIRAAWRFMMARGGGSIVNFSSVAAKVATRMLGTAAHSTGKGGILSLTRQLAYEGASHKIRVNAVSPGIIHTPAAQFAFDHMPGFEDAIRAKTMLGRHGKPEDVAWAIVYLCSDEANWITGIDLPVDGGVTAW